LRVPVIPPAGFSHYFENIFCIAKVVGDQTVPINPATQKTIYPHIEKSNDSAHTPKTFFIASKPGEDGLVAPLVSPLEFGAWNLELPFLFYSLLRTSLRLCFE
jgi:hypothetical protein